MPDHYLRSIWLGRLPPNIRTHLAGRPEIDLDTAAHCADCIPEVINSVAIESIYQPTNTFNLARQVEHLSRRMDDLITEHRYGARRRRPSSRDRRTARRSPSRNGVDPTTCWYHRRFGSAAQRCTKPCNLKNPEN
jgi:hypothetical protein